MAKLNFLKNKASNTWPPKGTMHVDLPQGLVDRYSFQELTLGSSRLSLAMRSVLQLLLFSLAFWPHSITGECNKMSKNVKEKENSESLDVSLAKFKVDCQDYFQA
jgi:hypothetical protein